MGPTPFHLYFKNYVLLSTHLPPGALPSVCLTHLPYPYIANCRCFVKWTPVSTHMSNSCGTGGSLPVPGLISLCHLLTLVDITITQAGLAAWRNVDFLSQSDAQDRVRRHLSSAGCLLLRKRRKWPLQLHSFVLCVIRSVKDQNPKRKGKETNGVYWHGYVFYQATASQGLTPAHCIPRSRALWVTNDVTRFTSHGRCYARA
jgi:hypothetical protein